VARCGMDERAGSAGLDTWRPVCLRVFLLIRTDGPGGPADRRKVLLQVEARAAQPLRSCKAAHSRDHCIRATARTYWNDGLPGRQQRFGRATSVLRTRTSGDIRCHDRSGTRSAGSRGGRSWLHRRFSVASVPAAEFRLRLALYLVPGAVVAGREMKQSDMARSRPAGECSGLARGQVRPGRGSLAIFIEEGGLAHEQIGAPGE